MSLFGSSTPASTKVTVIAQIRAKAGSEDILRKLLAALEAPSLQEPGCLAYHVYEDKHYTGSFFTHEEWESEDALQTHLITNKATLNKAKAMLAEDMRLNILQPVS